MVQNIWVSKIFPFQVMQGLAKSIAWDGEGATCLIEVCLLYTLVGQIAVFNRFSLGIKC